MNRSPSRSGQRYYGESFSFLTYSMFCDKIEQFEISLRGNEISTIETLICKSNRYFQLSRKWRFKTLRLFFVGHEQWKIEYFWARTASQANVADQHHGDFADPPLKGWASANNEMMISAKMDHNYHHHRTRNLVTNSYLGCAFKTVKSFVDAIRTIQ